MDEAAEELDAELTSIYSSSICEHGRRRYCCKQCGGSGICQHGRQRSKCKECGGGGICQHGRQRSQCKECGGGGICQHGRIRSRCKECVRRKQHLAALSEHKQHLAAHLAAQRSTQCKDLGSGAEGAGGGEGRIYRSIHGMQSGRTEPGARA